MPWFNTQQCMRRIPGAFVPGLEPSKTQLKSRRYAVTPIAAYYSKPRRKERADAVQSR